MTDIYQYLTQDLYVIAQANPAMDSRSSTVVPSGAGQELQSENIVSGEVDGNLSFIGGFIQSKNFVSGTSGWRLSANGTLEAVNATLSGSINATSGTIGGFEITATTLQTASSGARAVISSTDKSFYVYDSVGQVARIGIDSGFAITITPTSSTTGGIIISSSQAGNGYYYSNTANVASRGLFVEQTNSGASNSLPCIEARHAGNYYAMYAKGTNSSGGIIIDVAGGKGIYLLNAGATPAIDIADSSTSGSGSSLVISYLRSGAVVDISGSCSSGNLTGIKFNMNNSGGNEYAFEFAGGEVVSSAVGGSQNKKVRVIVGGTVYYIPLHDA